MHSEKSQLYCMHMEELYLPSFLPFNFLVYLRYMVHDNLSRLRRLFFRFSRYVGKQSKETYTLSELVSSKVGEYRVEASGNRPARIAKHT